MYRVILVTAGLSLLCSGLCSAGDHGFESTSEGITKGLLAPQKGRSSEPGSWGALAEKPKSLEKTKEVKVLKKEKGLDVWETITVPVKRTSGFVNLKIEFDVNSSRIRPNSFGILDELAKALAGPELRNRNIFINGHTDSDGKEKYNLELSLKRASAVKRYLTDRRGIALTRLRVVGYGESMPLKPNSSKKNKQLNRRVEIVVAE